VTERHKDMTLPFSDARAQEAFKGNPFSRVKPAVEIRCMGTKSSPCSKVVGGVWDMDLVRPVLMLYFWPDGVRSRNSSNRERLFFFLDQAGEQGFYSCRTHGTWRADLVDVRTCHDEALLEGKPWVVLPVRPPDVARGAVHKSQRH
jgi:hypothetical protein